MTKKKGSEDPDFKNPKEGLLHFFTVLFYFGFVSFGRMSKTFFALRHLCFGRNLSIFFAFHCSTPKLQCQPKPKLNITY